MELQSLLAITIYYSLGHAWMAFIGNTASRALRRYRELCQADDGADARPRRGACIGVVAFWAVIGPLFWPADVINSARQGRLPEL